MLTLGNDMSSEKKKERIDEVLAQVVIFQAVKTI
jgi:hypothetical protein